MGRLHSLQPKSNAESQVQGPCRFIDDDVQCPQTQEPQEKLFDHQIDMSSKACTVLQSDTCTGRTSSPNRRHTKRSCEQTKCPSTWSVLAALTLAAATLTASTPTAPATSAGWATAAAPTRPWGEAVCVKESVPRSSSELDEDSKAEHQLQKKRQSKALKTRATLSSSQIIE